MIRRPPISTRTDILLPYTTLFRSSSGSPFGASRFGLRTDFRSPQIDIADFHGSLAARIAPGGRAARAAVRGAPADRALPAGCGHPRLPAPLLPRSHARGMERLALATTHSPPPAGPPCADLPPPQRRTHTHP